MLHVALLAVHVALEDHPAAVQDEESVGVGFIEELIERDHPALAHRALDGAEIKWLRAEAGDRAVAAPDLAGRLQFADVLEGPAVARRLHEVAAQDALVGVWRKALHEPEILVSRVRCDHRKCCQGQSCHDQRAADQRPVQLHRDLPGLRCSSVGAARAHGQRFTTPERRGAP